jgi:type VI secretion system protein ImpE
MDVKMLVNGGLLGEVVDRLNYQEDNGSAHPRTFLFELLCLLGEWDLADKQLNVLAIQTQKPHADIMTSRNMVQAERHRRQVLSGAADPHFLIAPPPYVTVHLEALRMLREGRLDDAVATLKCAEDEWLRRPGSMGDHAFQSFRDADAFLGPVLEVITDRYIWLPYEQIKRLEISAPRRLRDLLWIPVGLETVDGRTEEVCVPVHYARSCEHSSNHVALGRGGDLRVKDGDVGLRQFMVDGKKRALLDIREVEFEMNGERKPWVHVM